MCPMAFLKAFEGLSIHLIKHIIRDFNRIIECFRLEGAFRGHLVQPLCSEQGQFNYIRLLRDPSNLTLNVSRDGASTTSLGNLFQCFTTLSVKNAFLISSLNLPSFSLKPSPLVLSQQPLLKSLTSSFLPAPFKHWKAAIRSPWSLLFPRLNHPNSPSPPSWLHTTYKASI